MPQHLDVPSNGSRISWKTSNVPSEMGSLHQAAPGESHPNPECSIDGLDYIDGMFLDYTPTDVTVINLLSNQAGEMDVHSQTGSDDDMIGKFCDANVVLLETPALPLTNKILLGSTFESEDGRMALPISRDSLEILIRKLRLPTMVAGLVLRGYCARYGTSCATHFEHGDANKRLIGFALSFRDAFVGGPRACMIIATSVAAATSHCIHFSRNATQFDTVSRLYNKHEVPIFHPIYPVLLFADSVRSACEAQHDWLATNLVDIELMSGFQSYSFPHNSSIASLDREDTLDFVTSLQNLKRISDGNMANILRRKSLSETLKDSQTFSEKIEEIFNFPIEVVQHRRSSIQILRSWCDGMEGRQDLIADRIKWQLSIIPSYLAHRDSKINISIAKDSKGIAAASKHDSTAMKTVSFLTAAFLPGTFVAAVFAMPLFKWDAGDTESVISSRFWIYWAISLPLTITISSGTAFWTWRKQQEIRKEDADAKAELSTFS